jgi:hypothetical protein
MNNDNYVLNVLNELPEQWIGKEMNLHVITDRKDAIWIINRMFQDVASYRLGESKKRYTLAKQGS